MVNRTINQISSRGVFVLSHLIMDTVAGQLSELAAWLVSGKVSSKSSATQCSSALYVTRPKQPGRGSKARWNVTGALGHLILLDCSIIAR